MVPGDHRDGLFERGYVETPGSPAQFHSGRLADLPPGRDAPGELELHASEQDRADQCLSVSDIPITVIERWVVPVGDRLVPSRGLVPSRATEPR